MILYCIRHGESVFNAEGRIQGQADIALSDFGKRQSVALAKALGDSPIQAIYCSPLHRAMETVEPIAEALRLKIIVDDRLKEIHAGIFQGLLWSEIEQKYPAEAIQWKSQEPEFVIPGGESRRQLMLRGGDALRDIRTSGHQQVVVVTHGGLLSAALKSLLMIPGEIRLSNSFCNAWR